MNESYVTVSGNVVNDPQLRSTKDGTQPFVTFRLASTSRRVDYRTGEIVDTGTNFFNVIAWRNFALNVVESLAKGQPVVVHGRLRVNQWRAEGKSGTDVEIDALTIGHDLKMGRSKFARVARATVDPAGPRRESPDDGASSAAGGVTRSDPGAVTPSAGEPAGDQSPGDPAEASAAFPEGASPEGASPEGHLPGGEDEPEDDTTDPFVRQADTDDYVLTKAVAS